MTVPCVLLRYVPLLSLRGVPSGTTWQSPRDFGGDRALGSLALRLPRCHCEECRQARRGNPLGISGMTVPCVLLRYAVEGIASSLRRLAPRNDNRKCRGKMGEACLALPRASPTVQPPSIRPHAGGFNIGQPRGLPLQMLRIAPFCPLSPCCHCEECR